METHEHEQKEVPLTSEDAVPSQTEEVTPLSNDEVTRHTASLWKYHQVPKTEPEPHEEYDTKVIRLPCSKIVGARVRGKKHKHEGTNCDDWFEIDHVNDWGLIAVSDGAGSKKYSRIGAKESCKASINYMRKAFKDIMEKDASIMKDILLPFEDEKFTRACRKLVKIVQDSILKAYEAIENIYLIRKDDVLYTKSLNRTLVLNDFASTLLVAVVIPVVIQSKRECLVISCQIGDGALALIDEKEPFETALKIIGEADSGSFSGETEFLTTPAMKQIDTLMQRTKIARRKISHLMVMTDGVADDYFPNNPELLRLYFDLQLNGILKSSKQAKMAMSKENIDLIKMIPEPEVYNWVNDPSVSVAVQYTSKIMEKTGLDLETLWNNKDIIRMAFYQLDGTLIASEEREEEKLKIWLDNYVQRGSFDDRTLVIFHME